MNTKLTQKLFLILLCMFTVVSGYSQEVVELKLPKSDKIVVKLMFRNGSVCDPKGKDGLTDLVASVITEGGTSEKTSSQIKDFIYPMAAGYSATVDKEVTVFTFSFHKDFAEAFYPIMKGLILTPRFAEDDFNRVKSNQQNYVDQVIKSSSDEEYSKKALEDFLFRGTNYQHMVEGTSSGVKAITLEDVKNQYKNFFGVSNLTIGIAGNYPPDLLALLKKDLNNLPAVISPLPNRVKTDIPKGINVEIIAKDEALGSAIFAGFPLDLTRKDDDFAALMVANSWLGEHRKSYSRLYQKIREARSMNYGDYTYIEWYNNGGQNMLPQPGFPRSSNYFSIWIRPVQTAKGLKGQYPELADISVGHAHFALRMAIREMDNLINKGMSAADFELTKTFLRSYMKLYIQTPAKQLGFLMDSRFYGRKDYIAEMDQLLAKLTLQDVNAAMKKYWQISNMDVTIVTDKSEADPLAKSLRENTPSPMSYSNALKGVLTKEILTEDDEVSTFPLKINEVKVVNSNDYFN